MRKPLCLLAALLLALCALTGAAAETITGAQELVNYLAEHDGELPDNFFTSKEMRGLGWNASENDVSDVAPGFSIGGDTYQNREGLLPALEGRTWRCCDCDYVSGRRNGHRLCWSNDGLYYYTEDGYRSFTQLFPDGEREEDSGPVTDAQGIADYIFAHGCLPPNFITKEEAKQLGWEAGTNFVSDVAPGCSIGGDRFGNYQGKLPVKKGRQYYECDVGYEAGERGAERIIYSNDGLVYLTLDHYNTFTQLYPGT